MNQYKETIFDHDKYRITEDDLNFYYSDAARGLRLQVDYLKAEEKMKEEGIEYTIVVFGSARTDDNDIHYTEARKFGRLVGASGTGPEDCHVKIATGGGPGIMEAANRGAHDVGAKSIGLNIKLPHEQFPNPYITPELSFQFYYFGIRKLHFLQRAKALVVFPGGFGTIDELFDIFTLMQTKKSPLIPVILISKEFWESIINFNNLVEKGVINHEDLNLFSYAEDAYDAWNMINSWYDERNIALFR
jgi:uncharacterized protein (TIGR00730 family)